MIRGNHHCRTNRSRAKRGKHLQQSKAGLLAYRSSRSGGLPIEEFNSGLNIASPLTVNSGATAREFHPLPFSLTD